MPKPKPKPITTVSQENILDLLDKPHTDTLASVRAPGTIEAYDRIMQYWDNFVARTGRKPTLDVQYFKAFFRILAIERPGLLSKHTSVNYLTHLCKRFWTAYKRRSGQALDEKVKEQTLAYIKGELKEELLLHSKPRHKPTLHALDLEALLHFLWVEDDHSFSKGRIRVQLALMLQLFAFSSQRPGSLVLSKGYYDPAMAVTYEDITCVLWRDDNDDIQIMIKIAFNARKGEKRRPNEYVELNFWEDREQPHLCPIILFLALAFEDNAFEDLKSHQDLFNVNLATGVGNHIFNFKKSHLKIPLFRAARSAHPDCQTNDDPIKAWTVSAVDHQFSMLAMRAGYEAMLTPYCARRGAADVLNKQATIAEAGMILGHLDPKTTQKYYLDRHQTFDLQNQFQSKEPHLIHANLQNLVRIPGAPSRWNKDLPGYIYDEIDQDGEVMELRSKLRAIEDEDHPDREELRKVQRKLYAARRSLDMSRLKSHRASWFCVQRSNHLVRTNQSNDVSPEIKDDQHQALKISPLRAGVIESLYIKKASIPMVEILPRLYDLCHQSFCVFKSCPRSVDFSAQGNVHGYVGIIPLAQRKRERQKARRRECGPTSLGKYGAQDTPRKRVRQVERNFEQAGPEEKLGQRPRKRARTSQAKSCYSHQNSPGKDQALQNMQNVREPVRSTPTFSCIDCPRGTATFTNKFLLEQHYSDVHPGWSVGTIIGSLEWDEESQREVWVID